MAKPMMRLGNPAAGRSTTHTALGAVVETFCSDGWNPTVYFTTGPRTAIALTARYGGEYERLVCLGGDGTLSETIAGLMQLPPERRPELGYIPMGTANDVASTLELPHRKPLQAAQDVLTLLSQDGIYTDDLAPDHTRPEMWRRFAQGERGRTVAQLGAIHERATLGAVMARMREDTIFRDAAHHFLRLFDRILEDFEPDATDEELVALSGTRTARAFMLIGRAAGVFG